MNKIYLPELKKLENLMERTPDTPFHMVSKVMTLIVMNMRYEKVAFNRRLRRHPYLLTRDLVVDAVRRFEGFKDIAFIEESGRAIRAGKSLKKEVKHKDLFDEIWNRYEDVHYRRYIQRYVHRIRINRLEPLIRGKRCLDLGCGNGNFCFALLQRGADSVAGIDFGGSSIAFASKWAARHKLQDRAKFKAATVYKTGYPDSSFDFAIQNGVFHHLDDEDRAIRETARVLKPGGWFWYYTDGEGGISYDLWDASVRMLRRVPVLFIEQTLKTMNVSRDKTAHIMDGLQATYAHTSWDKMTRRLARFGFGRFKRLRGGTATDCDLDVIRADPYGRAKFGEGDLRILCQLVRK